MRNQKYLVKLGSYYFFSGILSSEGQAVRSPRFSLNGEYLVWLQRPSGGAHHGAQKLMCCKWNSQQVCVCFVLNVFLPFHTLPGVAAASNWRSSSYCVKF
jgi:hypothetical protein